MLASRKPRKIAETKSITCLLNKFPKKDIITEVIDTPTRKKSISKVKGTKAVVIQQAIRDLKEKFSDLDELILFLSLRYILTQKLEKTWKILEIQDAKRLRKSNLTSGKVSISINKYFTKHMTKCKVFCEERGDCMWIVLILGDNRTQPIYCAARKELSLVFVCNLKSDYSSLTEKVLRKTFRGSQITLVTSCFKSNAQDIQSLKSKSWMKVRKKKPSQDEIEKAFDNVEEKDINLSQRKIDVDPEEQPDYERIRETEFEEDLTNSALPVIKDLKYKVWSSGVSKSKRDSLISLNIIKFQGTDILKGLDELIELGIADASLPDYLYKEPRSGKLEFAIR